MADFLIDYSNLTGAGAAFKGFAQGWQDADDRRLKKMELDSRLKTQEQDRTRQAIMDKLSLQKAGYAQGDDGDLEEAPLTDRQRGEEDLKAFGMGAKVQRDENGNIVPGSITYDPGTLKAHEAEAKAAAARASMAMRGDRLDETKDQHGINAGKALEDDSMVKAMKGTRQNIARARSIMNGKTPVTAQTFAMLQQDAINAAAPGGAATEGKISREMLDTFAAKLNDIQARFGNVKDLRTEQPQVFAQLKGMLDQMDGEYQKGIAQRVQDLAGNYAHSSNSKVRAVIGDKLKQYGTDDNGQGLLQQPQGLLGQPQGLIQPNQGDPSAQDPDMAAKVKRLQELRAKAAAGGQ